MTRHLTRKRRFAGRRWWIALALGVAAASAHAQALPPMEGCGPLSAPGQYGPYDYRTDRAKLPIVLGAHFTPEVEALIRGHTSTKPGSDIAYTLRAIPNNHRALLSMVRLGEKEKTPQPFGSEYTVECWLSRGINFRPDDVIVRMIYATYLGNNDRITEAQTQLAVAETLAKDNALTHYNIGLHYFDLKDYDRAVEQAHKATALGWKQTELRDRLVALGKWKEPLTMADATAPPASSASAPARPASQP
jgi:hypothetical protein